MSCGGVSAISLPSKRIEPCARRREAGDRAQRRGLARAVRADQRDDLALLDLERDALERGDVAVVGVDVVELEQRHQLALLSEVGLDHAVVRPDLVRLALGDLLAVVEHPDVLGHAHDDLHVVLDQEDRQVLLLAELVHELGEPLGLLRVHAGRGLVEQQQLRVGRERPRDLHAALVAVGQVRRASARAGRSSAPRTRASRAPSRATSTSSRRTLGVRRIEPNRPGAACARAEPTITFSRRRHRREQADVLERARHAGSAVIRSGRRPVTSCAVEQDPAGRRLVEPGEHVEEGRLAGAVRADDRDDRLRRDVDRHVADRQQAAEHLGACETVDRIEPFALTRAPRRRDSVSPDALGQLHLAPALGQDALGSQHHHHHEDEAEDPERDLDEAEVQPEVLSLSPHQALIEHVRDQRVFTNASATAPSTTPRCCRARRG